MALELRRDTQAAIVEYKKAFELNADPAGLVFIAHAEAAMGRQGEARKRLAQLTDAAKSRYVQPYAFALIHLALRQKSDARLAGAGRARARRHLPAVYQDRCVLRSAALRPTLRSGRAEGKRHETMKVDNFFSELKRRSVYQVAVAAAEKARRSPGSRSIWQWWFAVPLCVLRNA